MLGPQSPYA
jgi:hypothetical protein